jgi:hypothetical protein
VCPKPHGKAEYLSFSDGQEKSFLDAAFQNAAAGKQKTPLQAAAGLADYPSDLISQVKVVAGACNQRYLRLSQTALPC